MQNVIIKVEKNSIAEELGIEPGDILNSINDTEITDVFDYRYIINDDYVEVSIIKPSNEEWIFEVEKDVTEDLGIIFESGLMDNAKSCKNKCIFCFVDQMPKGMRKTLYFKDDDARLSFLQGNYVTLTNMKEKDLDRVIFYRLSPINISVHTTDMELRYFMLKNPNAKNLFKYIEKISNAGIEMNFQIVLCKDINDGKYLEESIDYLSKVKGGKSLSIVPVGISKYREKLHHLESFTPEDAKNVIECVKSKQDKLKNEINTRFVYASDEFYLLANLEMPPIEEYEDFPQIENGVGMTRNFNFEVTRRLHEVTYNKNVAITIATGELAYDNIVYVSSLICKKFKNIHINVYKIINNFFGEKITVVGLLTGIDFYTQLKNKDLGDYIFISSDAFKSDEDIFLDDMTMNELEDKLNTKIKKIKDGTELVNQIINIK
ncbi:MAG: DUF512 domain-containing protein [Lachnospirales bacterium]